MTRSVTLLWPKKQQIGFEIAPLLQSSDRHRKQPATTAAVTSKSQPIAVPGSGSSSPRLGTPKQGGEARRPAFLRQGSDFELDAQDATAAVATAGYANIDVPQPLGSWATRQRVLPLPAKPAGFPTLATKAQALKHARQPPADADAAWRYAFRRKWRREQLRALLDGPDFSPEVAGTTPPPGGDDDMMFGFDDDDVIMPAAATTLPPAEKAAASESAAAASVAPQRLPVLRVVAPVPVPAPLPALKSAGEVVAADAAIPGLAPIRRVVMRGAAKPALSKFKTGNFKTATERMWVPKMTSPARASQAA